MPLHLPNKSADILCNSITLQSSCIPICWQEPWKYIMSVIIPANLTLAGCSPSVFAAAAVVLLVLLQLGRTWWRLRHIPGPFFAKFTNFQRVYWVKTKRAHLILQEAHEKYGELVRIGPNTVSIHNPELIPTIYTARLGFPKVSILSPNWLSPYCHSLNVLDFSQISIQRSRPILQMGAHWKPSSIPQATRSIRSSRHLSRLCLRLPMYHPWSLASTKS